MRELPVPERMPRRLFGAVDGYGLYPFTPRALWNAASRADRSMPERLNPRVLQNDLLVEVLDNYAAGRSRPEHSRPSDYSRSCVASPRSAGPRNSNSSSVIR